MYYIFNINCSFCQYAVELSQHWVYSCHFAVMYLYWNTGRFPYDEADFSYFNLYFLEDMNLDDLANNSAAPQQTPPPAGQMPPQSAAAPQPMPQVNQQPVQAQAQQPVMPNSPASQAVPAVNPYAVQQAPQPTAPSQPNINVHVDGAKENIVIEWLNDTKKKKDIGIFRFLVLLSLVLVGILMLLESINVLYLNIGGLELTMLYPIIVILSVIVLFVYRKFIGFLLGTILMLVVIGGLGTVAIYHSLVPGGPSKFDDSLQFMIGDSPKAEVRINTYVGDYTLSAANLSAWSGSSLLLSGTYSSDRALLESTWFTATQIPYLYLKEDGNRNLIQNLKSDLDLGLSMTKTFDLYFKNLVGNYSFNLDGVVWDKVTIHGWIGNMGLAIGNDFVNDSELQIKSARSKINLTVPKDVGVKLYYDQIAGSIELPNFVKSETEKNYFESINLNEAKKIVKVSVDVGMGKFKVIRKD